MRHFLAIGVIYFAVVLQTTLANQTGFAGGTPYFPALALILLNRLNCHSLGTLWSALAGLLCDALGDGRLGPLMIVFVTAHAFLQALFADRNLLTATTQNRSGPLLAVSAFLVAQYATTVTMLTQSIPLQTTSWQARFEAFLAVNWLEKLWECLLSSLLTGGWMFLLIVTYQALTLSLSRHSLRTDI